MNEFRFIPIPAEDYDALGINAYTVLQTYVTDDGVLIARAVNSDDYEDFACDGECDICPVALTDCDSDCFSCPCCAHCDISEGASKSHKGNILTNKPKNNILKEYDYE